MRGIGKGQKLSLLLVPEVKRLIDREVQHKDPNGSIAKDAVAWLVTNSFRSEKVNRLFGGCVFFFGYVE